MRVLRVGVECASGPNVACIRYADRSEAKAVAARTEQIWQPWTNWSPAEPKRFQRAKEQLCCAKWTGILLQTEHCCEDWKLLMRALGSALPAICRAGLRWCGGWRRINLRGFHDQAQIQAE